MNFNKKAIGIFLVTVMAFFSIIFLVLVVTKSTFPEDKKETEKPTFEFKKETKLSDDGIPLRDDLKRESAIRDITELNNEITKFKKAYPKYEPTEKMCFDMSNVGASAGFPISYTKLENNPKYQALALKYTKIRQDYEIMFKACRFNIVDKSNIAENTKLYDDFYNNTLKLIEVDF